MTAKLTFHNFGDWGKGVYHMGEYDINACVKILVAGDLCPIGRVENLRQSGRGCDAIEKLTGVLSDQDLSVFNLECPLTLTGTPNPLSGHNLHAHPDWAIELRRAGFDVATLANNHVMDMGEPGLMDTLSACKMAELRCVGAGSNITDATCPLVLDIRGVKLAIVALAENEWSIATANTPGAAPLDPIGNYYNITAACSESDFVLVVLHGGNEHYALPSPRMVKTCRYFVDIGANAVVCHHSHTATGFEIYEGAPIVYGTGNLLFDWPIRVPDAWHSGYMVGMTIGSGSVVSMDIFPYEQCRPDPWVRPMPKERAKAFLLEIESLSKIIMDAVALESSWMDFCNAKRPDYIMMALCLTRPERLLMRMGLRPWWRSSKEQIRVLHNIVRCESHRDVLLKSFFNQEG